VDVRFVQEFLGHSRLESTQRYLRLGVEELREAVEEVAEELNRQKRANKSRFKLHGVGTGHSRL